MSIKRSGDRYSSSAQGGAKEVLVVEDEPALATLAGEFLERLDGVTTRVETDPEAALDQLDGDVDCVVSDYKMPAMDGLEFLDAVRDDHPDLPFVLFSGIGGQDVAEQAREQGARCVPKGQGRDVFDHLVDEVAAEIGMRHAKPA